MGGQWRVAGHTRPPLFLYGVGIDQRGSSLPAAGGLRHKFRLTFLIRVVSAVTALCGILDHYVDRERKE